MPGAAIGLQAEDPTIATALKAQGYATGQFGKNHLGDRDEFLPTTHGFDEFFGNLYHLNAEEEPEQPDYPTPEDFPNFRERFGPRGVIHSWANDDGTQRIEDTGPAHQEADGDVRRGVPRRGRSTSSGASTRPTRRSSCGSTRPTCTSAPTASRESRGRAGRWQSEYHDTMLDHDDDRRASCSTCSTSSASPRTRSSCTRPTTGRT